MKAKSRDEAIAAGVNVSDVQHKMSRRLLSHDYHAVGTYMLTLVVEGRLPLFGQLCGTVDAPRVVLSALGKTIRDVEQKKISQYYPMVEVWKLCVMPDHLHLIVRVKAPLPEGRHLGHMVSGFKSGCSRAWWALQDAADPCGEPQGTGASPAASVSAPISAPASASTPVSCTSAPVPCGSPQGPLRPVLFEKGYCDKVLLRDGQLDNWKRYLDDNPRRLFIKRLHPEYFTVLHQIQLMDHLCQIIGNQFLLNLVVPQGGWHISRFIEQQAIPFNYAEHIKCTYGKASPRYVEHDSAMVLPSNRADQSTQRVSLTALAEFIEMKEAEILQPILDALRPYEERLGGVYLTGDASMLDGLVDWLQERTSLPVQYGSHAYLLDRQTDDEFCKPRYTSLIGALIHGSDWRDSHTNLVVPDHKSFTSRVLKATQQEIIYIFSDTKKNNNE